MAYTGVPQPCLMLCWDPGDEVMKGLCLAAGKTELDLTIMASAISWEATPARQPDLLTCTTTFNLCNS